VTPRNARGPGPWPRVCRGIRVLFESGKQSFCAIGEDLFDVGPDKESIDERTSINSIANVIAAHGSAILRLKGMFVKPLAIRSFDLLIRKAPGRFPIENSGAPTQRNTSEPDPVINEGAGLKVNRPGCDNFESQPGWSERLQIMGVREKLEDFGRGSGEPNFGSEGMDIHKGAPPVWSGAESFSNNFDQGPFSPAAIEFAVKDLFPGTKIEFSFGDGHDHFAPHDLAF
jgi:hypothetical protein